ncbi:hypothetical protein, partial [Klebsiella quasipneumoniae]|uniref:hypothetical protein n=1 Tax=Klebsiella quasipneumoniae TaxID=1463165 RepID=UPI002730E18C
DQQNQQHLTETTQRFKNARRKASIHQAEDTQRPTAHHHINHKVHRLGHIEDHDLSAVVTHTQGEAKDQPPHQKTDI